MAIVLKKYTTKKNKEIPYLYQDERSYFWVRKRFGDQTPRKSLDTDVESIAISKVHAALAELEAESLNKVNESKKSNVLVKDYYKKMIEQKIAAEIRPSTLARIDILWRLSIEPFWGNLTADEIDKDHALKFMEWHRENRKGIQFQNVFKYIGNIIRLMVEDGHIPMTRRPKFILPKTEQRHHKTPKGRYIEHDEYLSIKKSFDERYLLILEMAYELGPRKMELGALKCETVIKRKGRLFLDYSHYDTKTGIPRLVPIPDHMSDRLWNLKRKNQTYIFEAPTDGLKHISSQVLDKLWVKAKASAQIETRTRFHDLRHTATTNFVNKANVNPILIATFLGMSIKTLQEKYYKLSPEALLILIGIDVNLKQGET